MCVCVCAEEGVSVCLGGWMGREGQVSGLVAVFHSKTWRPRRKKGNPTGRIDE